MTDRKVVFSVIVYEDGQMEYTCQTMGNPAVDEIILRGWLDKVREGVLDALKQRQVLGASPEIISEIEAARIRRSTGAS